MQGYKQRNAYIATQGPLKNTVDDLWRMMWEFKSKTMVTLCSFTEEGEEACYPFWPTTEGEKTMYGTVAITLQASTNYDQFITRKFMLQESKVKRSQKKPIIGVHERDH